MLSISIPVFGFLVSLLETLRTPPGPPVSVDITPTRLRDCISDLECQSAVLSYSRLITNINPLSLSEELHHIYHTKPRMFHNRIDESLSGIGTLGT